MSELYKKDIFINPSFPFLFNREIIEYDMKEAGFSLIKEFHLLPDETIEKLSKLKKDYRTKQIGKMEISNKKLVEYKKKAFEEARKQFFTMNDIKDEEVLSIKKDALFIIRPGGVTHTMVGKYIDFREKNQYTSYIQFPKKVEVYYSPQQIDIKGIGQKKELHADYMISFISRFCNRMETDTKDKTIEFIRRFVDRYKKRQLEVGYYREFNTTSEFLSLDGSTYSEYYLSIDDLDISYNFFNIILKIAKIPL